MNTPLFISILLVIFIILGFNIFHYFQIVGKTTTSIAKPVYEEGKQLTKTIGETALGAVEGGIQGTIQGAVRGGQQALDIDQSPDEMVQNARESIYISSYLPHRNELKKLPETKRESEIGKDGYCLIGQEGMDGVPRRACVRVGINDRCMSNKIYPTMDICVNPSLRT